MKVYLNNSVTKRMLKRANMVEVGVKLYYRSCMLSKGETFILCHISEKSQRDDVSMNIDKVLEKSQVLGCKPCYYSTRVYKMSIRWWNM